MNYISRTKSGYLVRKRVKGHPYQAFFGDKACGGRLAAKQAAVAYRDKFLNDLEDNSTVSRRFTNTRNSTGMIGVAWYAPEAGPESSRREHVIRARVTDATESHRVYARSWSVRRYGLWQAYFSACDWRYRKISNNVGINPKEAEEAFEIFLDNYLNTMQEAPQQYAALLKPLEDCTGDQSAPEAVRALVEQKLNASIEPSAKGTDL